MYISCKLICIAMLFTEYCRVMMFIFFVQFMPYGGPLKGGTKLKVNGENLGRTVSQLAVTLGGSKCDVISQDFVPTLRFV